MIEFLIAEINDSRDLIGKLGNDPTNSAAYHPFYITDSFEGGFGQKTEAQQREQRVYAGVEYDTSGFPFPTAG